MHRPFTLLAALLVAGSATAQEVSRALDAETEGRFRVAQARLLAQRSDLGLDHWHGFRPLRIHGDALGQQHFRFRQTYGGVPIFGGEAIVHADGSGNALGEPTRVLFRGLRMSTDPVVSQGEALALVNQDMAHSGVYRTEPTAELVIVPSTRQVLMPGRSGDNALDWTTKVEGYRLAWHCRAALEGGPEGPQERDFLIAADASEPQVLSTWSSLMDEAAKGTGKTRYSGEVTLDTTRTATGFELRDPFRGTYVTNMNNGTSGGTLYTDSDNVWGDGINYSGGSTTAANGQTTAADAAYGLQLVWDVLTKVLGRQGVDGQGSAFSARVHYDKNYNNAFYSTGTRYINLGDGGDRGNTPTSTGGGMSRTPPDTIGHETNHAVQYFAVALTYSGESGGLNEGGGDILGAACEAYRSQGGTGEVLPDSIANTSPVWTHGEQPRVKPLRYLYKPSLDGKCLDVWTSNTKSLDPHYSCAPTIRFFFFLSQGASASSSSSYHSTKVPGGFPGIGMTKALRIWYRALTTYFTSGTTFAQARTHCLTATKDLFGATGPEYAAVQNAWAAVAVGSPAPVASELAIAKAPAATTVVEGKTATFTVEASGGTPPYAYQWLRNGSDVGAATEASYTFTAALADDGSTFACRVSDSAGATLTSSGARLTVTPVATSTFTILSQPKSLTVTSGKVATFSVGVGGAAAPTFQWYRNGTAIAGATASTYSFTTSWMKDNGARFKVVVKDGAASLTSSEAKLTVSLF